MFDLVVFQRRKERKIPKKCIWNQNIIGFKDLFVNKKNNKTLAFDAHGRPKRGMRLTDTLKDDSLFMIYHASGHKSRPTGNGRFGVPYSRRGLRYQNKRSMQMQNDAPVPLPESTSYAPDSQLSTVNGGRKNRDKSAARRRSERRRAKKTDQSFSATYDQEMSIVGFPTNVGTPVPWPEMSRPTLPSWLESKLATSASRQKGRKTSSKTSSKTSRTRNSKNKKKRKSKRNKKSKPIRHRSRNNR